MYRNKFIFGLNNNAMQAELLKTHLKPDNTPKSMADVVTKAKALESAYTAKQADSRLLKINHQRTSTLGETQRNEAKKRAGNMPLVWRQTGTSPMETMPSKRQNMLKVWYQ